MLWMQTYLFYCSVRLGVIVIAITTAIEVLTPAVLLQINGISLLDAGVDVFQNDDYYKQNVVVHRALIWIDKNPQNVIIIVQTLIFMQLTSCILAIYGAAKLLKYFLIPFICMELMRVILFLIIHIVLMIVLKKIINLGPLVVLTLLGGFILLFLAYNWCACVALFQIFNLIRSDRYRRLYGDDPFSPTLMMNTNSKRMSQDTIENVHVIQTPNGSVDIDELKRKNKSIWKLNYLSKEQRNHGAIIAVVPVNTNLQTFPNAIKNDGGGGGAGGGGRGRAQEYLKTDNYNSMNTFNNWQWSELLIKGSYKKNALIGMNWQQRY